MNRRFDIEETKFGTGRKLTVLCEGWEIGAVSYDDSIDSYQLRNAIASLVKIAIGEDYDRWKKTYPRNSAIPTVECTFRVAV